MSFPCFNPYVSAKSYLKCRYHPCWRGWFTSFHIHKSGQMMLNTKSTHPWKMLLPYATPWMIPWNNHLVIWQCHGESLINGGFNGKIIYKCAIYTMAMLVITRGYNQNHQSGARPGHQTPCLKWADRGGSKPKARTWRRLARRPSGSVFPLCQQRWIVVNNGFTG